MYRTVLCDLDGTLIDSSREIAAAFRYALNQTVPGDLPEPAAIVIAYRDLNRFTF
jgi:phosphoglycolate phosphatase-like HAD superfamily hydrolase